MKKFIIAMIGLALAVAVLLTGVLVVALSGNFSFSSFLPELKLANRQVFSAADFSQLSLAYTSDRVTVLAGNDGEIVLEERMSRWEDKMLAKINTGGNGLEIQGGDRPGAILFGWRCQITLYVPREYLGPVSLSNTSGTINVEDDFSFGSFEAKNTSGSIRVQNLDCQGAISMRNISGSISAEDLLSKGNVTVDNSSGSIRMGALEGADLKMKNISGSIRLDSAKGKTVEAGTSSGSISVEELNGIFDLSSTSGSIRVNGGAGNGKAVGSSGTVEIELDDMTGDVEMRTTSGSCRLNIPQNTGFTFAAKTNSGSIHVPDQSNVTMSNNKKQASGDVGGGGELRVNMESSSGSVRIEYK